MARTERNRYEDMRDSLDQVEDQDDDCTISMLVQTVVANTYPTSASCQFAVTPIELDGPEIEGGTATLVPISNLVFYSFNAGSQIPPVGTAIVVHMIGGKWTFRYG